MLGTIKNWLTGFVILTTSVAHASFYAGVGVGSDTADYRQKSQVTKIGDFDVLNKVHLSGTGVLGTLFAGYGVTSNALYLAGELNGNLSSNTSNVYNREYVHFSFADTAVKIKNSIGISVLPGYLFTPQTLFYGRLGYTSSKIQIITSDVSLTNVNKRRDGFRYGLGINQAITERLALRMDYSRIEYNSLNTATLDPLSAVTKLTGIKPTEQVIEFGLIMNFA